MNLIDSNSYSSGSGRCSSKEKRSPFLLKPKSIENTKYDPIEKIREKMQEREPEQVREKAQETKPEQVREKVQDEEQGQARKQTSAIEADKESVLQSEPQFMMKIIL